VPHCQAGQHKFEELRERYGKGSVIITKLGEEVPGTQAIRLELSQGSPGLQEDPKDPSWRGDRPGVEINILGSSQSSRRVKLRGRLGRGREQLLSYAYFKSGQELGRAAQHGGYIQFWDHIIAHVSCAAVDKSFPSYPYCRYKAPYVEKFFTSPPVSHEAFG
jgi:hypothetical protein